MLGDLDAVVRHAILSVLSHRGDVIPRDCTSTGYALLDYAQREEASGLIVSRSTASDICDRIHAGLTLVGAAAGSADVLVCRFGLVPHHENNPTAEKVVDLALQPPKSIF